MNDRGGVLIVAPNWLGDAVMALPAIETVRRAHPNQRLIVAARGGVRDLFHLVTGVDQVVGLSWRGGVLARASWRADVEALRGIGAACAILLPNSFASAWLVYRAGIRERWGYATDVRRWLLTRSVGRPTGSRHQARYYLHLVEHMVSADAGRSLVDGGASRSERGPKGDTSHGVSQRDDVASTAGAASGSTGAPGYQGGLNEDVRSRVGAGASSLPREGDAPIMPALVVPRPTLDAARDLLRARGYTEGTPLVVVAPGAAYGTAKQWPLDHVARLVEGLARDGVRCVLIGSGADRFAVARALRACRPGLAPAPIDLAGQTSLAELAGVLHLASACVSNDSGAMHVAAAVGTPVVALFGPTIEAETHPLMARDATSRVLTGVAWCRPCMLRDCPLDHQCMTSITPDAVHEALVALTSDGMTARRPV